MLIALFLRIAFLGYESLWADEVVTIRDSLKPITDIVNQRWDPHPPLYYLLLHYWLKLDQSDAFTRLPSVIFGVTSVWLIYQIGLRLASRRAAWFMAMLLAVSPLHIWYSQETRMYAMVVMWALASTFLWILLLQERYKSLWVWVGYIVTTCLGLYTHYSMLLIVIGQNLFVLARWVARAKGRSQYPLKYWLVSQLMLVLLYIPWSRELPNHWQVIRDSTDYPLWILSTPPALFTGFLLGIVAFVLLVLWLRKPEVFSKRVVRYAVYVFLIATVVLFLGFTAMAMTNRMTTIKRQTLILFPLLIVLLVYLWSYSGKRWQYGVTVLVVVTFLATCINMITYQKPRWREAVAFVQEQASANDGIVLNPSWINGPFSYYVQQNGEGSALPLSEPQVVPLQDAHETTWLIVNTKHELWQDPDHEVRNWLLSHYELSETTQFGELEVIRFQNFAP